MTYIGGVRNYCAMVVLALPYAFSFAHALVEHGIKTSVVRLLAHRHMLAAFCQSLHQLLKSLCHHSRQQIANIVLSLFLKTPDSTSVFRRHIDNFCSKSAQYTEVKL